MTTRDHKRSQGGFTLIEAMVSMFFLAFIVGELGMVSSYATRSSGLARRLTAANVLAEQIQESCRNKAYGNLQIPMQFKMTDPASGALVPSPLETVVACDSVVYPTASANRVCLQSVVLGDYTQRRSVTPIPATTVFSTSISADIDVIVSWTDAHGATQQIKVSTVRSKF